MSKTETVQNENKFTLLQDFSLADALSGELSGLSGSLERIRIPAGEDAVFALPGEEGAKPYTAEEFSAVILFHHPLHVLYQKQFAGGANPPQCISLDGVTGRGDPGGSCAVCTLNQSGSGQGRGKACKNRRRLYLLREGETLPLLFSLPTGSLHDFSRYLMGLLNKGRKPYGVVTRFSLKKVNNPAGFSFAQVKFAQERVLTDGELILVENMAAQARAYSTRGDGADRPQAAKPAEASFGMGVALDISIGNKGALKPGMEIEG